MERRDNPLNACGLRLQEEVVNTEIFKSGAIK